MIEFNKRNIRAWSIMGISPSIWSIALEEIINESEKPENMKILTADLERYSGLGRINNLHQNLVYNLGIAEQNMVGVAAGLSLEGFQVFMTTYAPFMTYRCADQLRHFMGNLKLPMVAVGSAAGFSAGMSGNALLALNDIAFMRAVPNMVVLSPADCTEAIKLMLAAARLNQPVYMRFCGTTGLPVVYQQDYMLEIGKPVQLIEGNTIAILATGTTIVHEALDAASQIEKMTGILPSVYDVHTIKPMNPDNYVEIFQKNQLIVTVEEHSIIGGLGSAIAELMVTNGHPKLQVMIGAEDRQYKLGNRAFMLEQAGLKAELIANKIVDRYKGV